MKNNEQRTKFNVDKDKAQRTCDGIVFDSIMEMRYYRDEILPNYRSGRIRRFELQKEYVLQPKFTRDSKMVRPITYVADFYVEYDDDSCEVIDTKGFADSTAKMKRKMFWYHYPDIKYRWICYSKIDGGWCDYDTVQHNRKLRKSAKLALARAQESVVSEQIM